MSRSSSFAALAAAIVSCSLVSATSADILVDQSPSGSGVSSQAFPDFPDFSSGGLDDFTLSDAYDLTSLIVYGSDSGGANPALNVSVEVVFLSAGDLGYTVLASATGLQVGGNLVFDLTGIQLAAGTYWLSARVVRPFGGGGQWFWSSSTSGSGAAALWQNPGGGFSLGGAPISWSSIASDGNNAAAFTLEGTLVPAPGALALLGLAGIVGRRRAR